TSSHLRPPIESPALGTAHFPRTIAACTASTATADRAPRPPPPASTRARVGTITSGPSTEARAQATRRVTILMNRTPAELLGAAVESSVERFRHHNKDGSRTHDRGVPDMGPRGERWPIRPLESRTYWKPTRRALLVSSLEPSAERFAELWPQ